AISHGAGGASSAPRHGLHDAPPAMAFALIVLAIGSVVAGYVSFGGRFEKFLEPSFSPIGGEAIAGGIGASVEAVRGVGPGVRNDWMLMAVSVVVAFAGIGIATYLFLKNRRAADRIAETFSGVHRVLTNKYYVDELYDAAVVQPIRIASEEGLWKIVDAKVIDGAVNGVGDLVGGSSDILRRLQTGSVRAYAASLFVGVVMILGYYLWR
ncbi:MAG TPA: hypothetical protein VGY57_11345, partial [Vicinamibacterales bacterium]|nr:hypothetical protein [Vicinamibacterales bacterium]